LARYPRTTARLFQIHQNSDVSASTARWLAIGLAILHVCLATWFASITPYRTGGHVRYLGRNAPPVPDIGAPDERQHVNYVKRLLAGDGFPVLNPKDPNLYEDYQAHQPPAFYVLGAAWCKVTGASNLDSEDGGKRLRLLNGLIGGVEVIAVFLLGSWGFKKPEIGVIAAAFAACLPMNVALSGAVNNDVLLYTLCTASLAIGALGIQEGWTNERCLALGICVALALLTKTTALALLPAILVAAVAAGPGRPKAAGWALALLPLILLPLPWWIRNEHFYGDPFAMKAFKDSFTGSAQAGPMIDGMGLVPYLVSMVGWWTARSFFGAFGYMDIWLNETGAPGGSAPNALYRVLIALSALIFIGWILSWKKYREDRTRQVRLMNLTFVAVVVILFLSFNLQYFQAQARYLLPAIGPIACGYAVGTLALTKERWLPALAAMVLIFGSVTVYAGTRLPAEFAKRM
jgi:4-amino-4-deoxy-L-arabinose transferase-like glycosyltransferase